MDSNLRMLTTRTFERSLVIGSVLKLDARSRIYAVEVLKAHPVVTGIVVALAASAVLNRVLAKRAERRNPPMGRFITVTVFGSTTLSEEQGARSWHWHS